MSRSLDIPAYVCWILEPLWSIERGVQAGKTTNKLYEFNTIRLLVFVCVCLISLSCAVVNTLPCLALKLFVWPCHIKVLMSHQSWIAACLSISEFWTEMAVTFSGMKTNDLKTAIHTNFLTPSVYPWVPLRFQRLTL